MLRINSGGGGGRRRVPIHHSSNESTWGSDDQATQRIEKGKEAGQDSEEEAKKGKKRSNIEVDRSNVKPPTPFSS
jgi:hypothetical protein